MVESRVVLITGGGTGLGKATAYRLADKGYKCVITGRRMAKLEEAVADYAGNGEIKIVPGDITDADARHKVVQACVQWFGQVDVLINNAANSSLHPILAQHEEEWLAVLKSNVVAPFFLAASVAPLMRARGWGRIVNIGSIYGLLGLANKNYGGALPVHSTDGPEREPAYGASKGAIMQLSREMATAFAPWGITVNTVTPGMFPIQDIVYPSGMVEALARATPVGRLGYPDEIAHAVEFLVSSDSSFITGANIVVDGGFSIW